MKKVLDKLFNVDKKVLLFLLIISIVGIVTGSFFMIILSSDDKLIITDSLNQFINSISKITTIDYFKSNFILNSLYLVILWLLGISVIGLPIVIMIIFFKSFVISLTFSSFIINFKFKGFLYGLIYNFPHSILNLLVYIYLGIYSIKLSLAIISSIIQKKNINFKNIMNRYIKIFLFSILIVILTTLYETFIMPLLLKYLLNVL